MDVNIDYTTSIIGDFINNMEFSTKHAGNIQSKDIPLYSFHLRYIIRSEFAAEHKGMYFRPPTRKYNHTLSSYAAVIEALVGEYPDNQLFKRTQGFHYTYDDQNIFIAMGYIEHNGVILLCTCTDGYSKEDYTKRTVYINSKLITDEFYKNFWKQIEKKYVMEEVEMGANAVYCDGEHIHNKVFDLKPVNGYKSITELNEKKHEARQFPIRIINMNSSFIEGAIPSHALPPRDSKALRSVKPEYQMILNWMMYEGVYIEGYYLSFENFLKLADNSIHIELKFSIRMENMVITMLYDITNAKFTIAHSESFTVYVAMEPTSYTDLVKKVKDSWLTLLNYFIFVSIDNLNDHIDDAVKTAEEVEVLSNVTPPE